MLKEFSGEFNSGKKDENFVMYQRGKESGYGNNNVANDTLISDKSRVYKGASWKDRAYYLNPGARRYLEENRSSSAIGFRCAMDRIGSSKWNRCFQIKLSIFYQKELRGINLPYSFLFIYSIFCNNTFWISEVPS